MKNVKMITPGKFQRMVFLIVQFHQLHQQDDEKISFFYHVFFIHSSVKGHLGCSHVSAVVDELQ